MSCGHSTHPPFLGEIDFELNATYNANEVHYDCFVEGLLLSELRICFIQILCVFMAVSDVPMLSKVFLLPVLTLLKETL